MTRTDYFLKNLLIEVMNGMGTHFENKETGKNTDNEIIKDLLKDEKVKDKFYMILENELIQSLEKKFPELKGNI